MQKLTIPYRRNATPYTEQMQNRDAAVMKFCGRLIEDVYGMAVGKQTTVSSSLVRESEQLKISNLKPRLEALKKENVDAHATLLFATFIPHDILFQYVRQNGYFYCSYGPIGQKANVNGLDFYWPRDTMGNLPVGEGTAVYGFDPSINVKLQYVMFVDEKAGGYPVSQELKSFRRMLLEAENEIIINPRYTPLTLKFAHFAERKYDGMEKSEMAYWLEKERFEGFAASMVHSLSEKKFIVENRQNLAPQSIAYAMQDLEGKTVARTLAEIAYGPNPFYTLYLMWKTAAEITQPGVAAIISARPEQGRAMLNLANGLPALDEFRKVREGSVDALRSMARKQLDALYSRVFQKQVKYEDVFNTKKIFAELLKLGEDE